MWTACFGYQPDDIVMLTDDATNPRQQPTKDNIVSTSFTDGYFLIYWRTRNWVILKINAMQWLVRGAQPNDSLFFHCELYRCVTNNDTSDGFVIRLRSWRSNWRSRRRRRRWLRWRSVIALTPLVSRTWGSLRAVVIYPVDYETNGHIVDDLMHDIMVKPLPPGCRLTAIFDVCANPCQCAVGTLCWFPSL